MLRKSLFIPLVAALATGALACGGGASSATRSSDNADANAVAAYANPQILAETAWLSTKLDDKTYAIVDLRKKEAYDAGHIPGAAWYDANKLKDPDDKYFVIRDTLFAQYLGEMGISNAKTVVAYDDNAGLSAARFWWVLLYYGQDKAMVLNGGWPKWAKEGLSVSKDAPLTEKATFKALTNSRVISTADYVKEQAAKKGAGAFILDVRTPAEYTGADVRSAKGGHVPTAVNLDYIRSLTDSDVKVWKSAAELKQQFDQAGIKKDSEIITYCQSGVRAAHALFTLRLMGYNNVRNYDGSWQEWGNSKDTPIEQ